MATYAVGDIQGCLPALECLLKKISFDPQKDKLWVCGDIVNRGPDSLGTLRFLFQMRNSVVAVLGNHDMHLLAIAHGYKKMGRNDNMLAILDAPDRHELFAWLRHRPFVHHDPVLAFTMVHAGIPPMWTIKKALKRSAEIEAVLQSNQFENYLRSMYGNTPDRWDKSLSGTNRWRLITNYFTRMRFCNEIGRLNLDCKLGKDQAPKGYSAWFDIKGRETEKDNIVFGHWASIDGKTGHPHAFALDTGCVWGRKLSAMRLEDKAWYSCEC
ncbi:symmetrical bis(5'-nucleosyl)-tetraphosphatase [Aurantivibrio infirmus]